MDLPPNPTNPLTIELFREVHFVLQKFKDGTGIEVAGWRALRSLAAGDRGYGLYRKRRTNDGGYYALKMLGKSWLLRGDYREVTGKRRERNGRVLLFVRPKWLLRSFVLGSAALLGVFVSRLSHVLLGTVEGTHA